MLLSSLGLEIQVVVDDGCATDPREVEVVFVDEVLDEAPRGPKARNISVDWLQSPSTDHLVAAASLRNPYPWQQPA